MDNWTRIIVEWINCLHLNDEEISDIEQMPDIAGFYSKVIKKLQYAGDEENIERSIKIQEFIEHAYPAFLIDKNYIDNIFEHIYQLSLLLLSASEHVYFHKPMYSLKQDTQIIVKQFLELLLPYGNTLTFDMLRECISEISDNTPKTPPKTPKDRSLRNFLTSPAAHTVYRHKILNECNRELRKCKAELETERFEKQDMQEDIKNLENKITNLQKQLTKKNDELKVLRIENTYSRTPKSARKDKNTTNFEECLRKEIVALESHNSKLQSELSQLEDQNEHISRRLSSKERLSITLSDKINEYEKGMELLSSQLEQKTNELLDLKMQNEELRSHIQHIQQTTLDPDQSFEVENLSFVRFPKSPMPGLNVSEAASSIIDIQLREANEESARLKSELDAINKKLTETIEECQEFKTLNDGLNEQLSTLDELKMTLEITEDKLEKRSCQINILDMEKKSLAHDLEKLKETLAAKQVILQETEENKNKIKAQLWTVKEELNNLKISLDTTEDTLAQTVASREVLVMQLSVTKDKVSTLENSLTAKIQEYDNTKKEMQEKIENCSKKIVNQCEEINRLVADAIEKNKNCENLSNDLKTKNAEINELTNKIFSLEESAKSSMEKIRDLDETISKHVEEKGGLEKVVHAKNEELNNLSKCFDTQTEEFAGITSKFQTLEKVMRESKERVNNLEDKILVLLADKSSLTESLDEKNEELVNLTVKLDNKNLENDLLIVKLSQTVDVSRRAEEKIHNLQTNIIEHLEHKKQLELTVKEKNESITKLNNELNIKNLEIDALKSMISQLEEITKNSEDTISGLEVNIKDYLAAKQQLDVIIQEKITEVQKMMAELATKTTEINSLQATIAQLEKKSQNADKNVTDLEKNISKHCEDKEKLEEMLQQSLKELQCRSEELECKNNEINVLKLKVVDLEEKVCANESTLSEYQTKICELNELHEELQSQLTGEHEKYRILLDSKRDLEGKIDEMTKHNEEKDAAAREKNRELCSRIELLTADLSAANTELAQQNTKFNRELENRISEYNELSLQLDELKRTHDRAITSYQERENAANKIVNSFEKKLLAAQNACETLKIEKKIQEESVTVISLKFEQLTKEKIESELKMKELIVNLQELRASGDSVMQAQSKALADKTAELEALEKTHLEMKKILESEIQAYKTTNEEKVTECISLNHANEVNLARWRELELELIAEKAELSAMREKYDASIANAEVAAAEYATRINELETDLDAEKNECKILGEKYEAMKNELDDKKQQLEDELNTNKKAQEDLVSKVNNMKIDWEKRDKYLSRLVEAKKSLHGLFEQVLTRRYELAEAFFNIRASWADILNNFQCTFVEHSSPCDELKQVEAKKTEIIKLLADIDDNQLKSSKPLVNEFRRIFLWSEKKLEAVFTSSDDPNTLDLNEIQTEMNLAKQSILEVEIEKEKSLDRDFEGIKSKIDKFSAAFDTYEANMKSGIIKREPTDAEKLQIQLEKMTKEKMEIKDKLDVARVRNAKMEKNMDELRNEIKKLKIEMSETSSDKSDIERLTLLTQQLELLVEELQSEKTELIKEKEKLEESSKKAHETDLDVHTKEVHKEYEAKLEKIKQKMKRAYNEQMEKLTTEKKKELDVKTSEMEMKLQQQCKKYTDDLAKYKAHVSDLSSQMWNVGEKLLAETQEKETLQQRLRDLQHKYNTTINEINHSYTLTRNANTKAVVAATAAFDGNFNHERDAAGRQSFRAVQVIEEETTTTRRHSVKSIQAMGNAFNAEDEEGEVFNNVYLTDLKDGKLRPIERNDQDRLSELRLRNTLCRPHLRSSYAVETHLHPLAISEDDIKNGGTEDLFNDSLSQSLLPGQKVKKKDRTQTSYKRPGPPTPSKNGGRLSLQGNELKSPNSRILRDRNSERRTTTTPKRLKDFFGATLSKRQDENTPATPKARRLSSIFRKPRASDKN